MTAEEQRIIGGLQVAVENLRLSVNNSRMEQREDMRRLFERQESMSQICPAHSARLDGIERRAAYIGVLVAAGVSAAVAAVLRWVRP